MLGDYDSIRDKNVGGGDGMEVVLCHDPNFRIMTGMKSFKRSHQPFLITYFYLLVRRLTISNTRIT